MKEHTDQVYNSEPLRLIEVYDSTLESDVLHVSELLKENGIHSEIKNTGIGSYLQIYGGVNYLGTSICVKEEDAEAAKALIENLWRKTDLNVQEDLDSFEFHDQESSDMEDYRRRYNKSLKWKKRVLMMFIFVMFGTALIVQFVSILN